MTIKESNGTRNGQSLYCPVNGWDCPYYENGICFIKDPMEDCDDWEFFGTVGKNGKMHKYFLFLT